MRNVSVLTAWEKRTSSIRGSKKFFEAFLASQQSNCFNKKYQILLPTDRNLTRLIINHEYIRLLHCGAQGTLPYMRKQY